MDRVQTFLICLLMVLAGVLIGNISCDNATLRDCSVKSQSRLINGAVIECTVKKDIAP